MPNINSVNFFKCVRELYIYKLKTFKMLTFLISDITVALDGTLEL